MARPKLLEREVLVGLTSEVANALEIAAEVSVLTEPQYCRRAITLLLQHERFLPSAQERVAAMNAARAIPPQEGMSGKQQGQVDG